MWFALKLGVLDNTRIACCLQVLMSGNTSATGVTQPCTVQQKPVQQVPYDCCWHERAPRSTLVISERE